MATDMRPCPLCGADSAYALTARDRNREASPESFTYNRCVTCRTVFIVDVPDDLARYYVRDYHGFGPAGTPEWTDNPMLLRVEAWRMAMLRRYVDPVPLIDVGAGAGAFSAAAKGEGFEVTAIEMDRRCCEYLETGLGVRAICSDQPIEALRKLPAVGAISMWHVLEHLPDPAEMLLAAAERLQPGGVLAIGVPNPGSLQFRLLRTRWAHLDAPRHLCLMPKEALVTYLQRLGMRLLESTTGDPFGQVCSLHGWSWALRTRPAQGEASVALLRCAQAITKALAPVEGRGGQGAALAMLFVKTT
jgi:2-polyprenyl-3-methyl-5-hydroxy-6-metoxy-1,4-benzoquinol methylase